MPPPPPLTKLVPTLLPKPCRPPSSARYRHVSPDPTRPCLPLSRLCPAHPWVAPHPRGSSGSSGNRGTGEQRGQARGGSRTKANISAGLDPSPRPYSRSLESQPAREPSVPEPIATNSSCVSLSACVRGYIGSRHRSLFLSQGGVISYLTDCCAPALWEPLLPGQVSGLSSCHPGSRPNHTDPRPVPRHPGEGLPPPWGPLWRQTPTPLPGSDGPPCLCTPAHPGPCVCARLCGCTRAQEHVGRCCAHTARPWWVGTRGCSPVSSIPLP